MCNPSKFAVVSANRVDITYGFRCAKHGVTKRYSTEAIREEKLESHKKSAKKS